jgi:hypothetical protein
VPLASVTIHDVKPGMKVVKVVLEKGLARRHSPLPPRYHVNGQAGDVKGGRLSMQDRSVPLERL